MKYYCYILTNKNRTVLYVCYTDGLTRRISQHKNGNGANFTKKYNVFDLIYIEKSLAKKREKQLKNWHKAWK